MPISAGRVEISCKSGNWQRFQQQIQQSDSFGRNKKTAAFILVCMRYHGAKGGRYQRFEAESWIQG